MEVLKFLEDQGVVGIIIFALWTFHKQAMVQLKELNASIQQCTEKLVKHATMLENGSNRMDKIENDIVMLRQHKHRMSDMIQRHEAVINKGERYDNEIH